MKYFSEFSGIVKDIRNVLLFIKLNNWAWKKYVYILKILLRKYYIFLWNNREIDVIEEKEKIKIQSRKLEIKNKRMTGFEISYRKCKKMKE